MNGFRRVNYLPPGVCLDPVIYTSGPSGPKAREHLAELLLSRLSSICLAGWNQLTIKTGFLKNPRLFLDGRPGPAISFSHGCGRTWATVGLVKGVGIDTAWADEFAEPYPYSRAFHEDEFQMALELCGPPAEAAALLWAIKEAASKAMGTGFHLLDPRDIHCGPCRKSIEGLVFKVKAGEELPVWVKMEGRHYLAVAVRGQTGRYENVRC